MKVGDKKQAAVLGVVAVGALLFLGSTILSAFGNGSPPPTQAEVRHADSPASAAGKLPDTEPTDASNEPLDSGQPERIEKTPFAAPVAMPPKKPVSVAKAKRTEEENHNGELPKLSGESEGTVPFDPTKDSMGSGSLGDARRGSNDEPTPTVEPEKPKLITVKYEGYVDAGNPVAIIRIGESQYTADQGEGLPYGVRVIAITSEKLTLSVRGRLRSVWIGREVQL